MKPVNLDDFASLDAALERAQRLWPNPFEAPDVPPRELLEAFRRGPEHLPQDMRDWLPAQIKQSVNCQLALEVLKTEEDPGHILHPLISPAEDARLAMTAWEEFKARHRVAHEQPMEAAVLRDAPAVPPHTIPLGSPEEPAVDQIWTTKGDVEIFNGRRPEPRRVWLPMNVLLAEGPIQDRGETLWRAMPCTPLEVWGEENVGDSEAVVNVPVEGEYVVHFRLEYPVSARQLHACIGTVEDSGIVPGNAPTTPELELERERVLECAAWLSATADAQRTRAEASVEPPMEPRSILAVPDWAEALGLEPVSPSRQATPFAPDRWQFRANKVLPFNAKEKIHEITALAARIPGSLSSQAIVLRGRPEVLMKEGPSSSDARPGPPKSAKILLEPNETTAFSGPAFARWDVSELVPQSFTPCQMIVLSPKLDAILANGYVRDGVAIAIGCDWEECRKTIDQWENWVLLIFDPSQ
jgi:hypothetical protein